MIQMIPWKNDQLVSPYVVLSQKLGLRKNEREIKNLSFHLSFPMSSGWKWYPIPLASGDYGGLPIQDYALESHKEGNPVLPVMKLGFSFAWAILF